jgi:dTDP-glucose 4,6-dehydratase
LIDGKKVPLYGDGLNIRDWLHVDDHCRGIQLVAEGGRAGEIYNIGGGTELTNRELTTLILTTCGFDEAMVERVDDRLGHDRRYSVNWSKINKELGYTPQNSLENSINSVVDWYRSNEAWWRPLKSQSSK